MSAFFAENADQFGARTDKPLRRKLRRKYDPAKFSNYKAMIGKSQQPTSRHMRYQPDPNPLKEEEANENIEPTESRKMELLQAFYRDKMDKISLTLTSDKTEKHAFDAHLVGLFKKDPVKMNSVMWIDPRGLPVFFPGNKSSFDKHLASWKRGLKTRQKAYATILAQIAASKGSMTVLDSYLRRFHNFLRGMPDQVDAQKLRRMGLDTTKMMPFTTYDDVRAYLEAFSEVKAEYYDDLCAMRQRGPGSTLRDMELYFKYIVDGDDCDKIEKNVWAWFEGGKVSKSAQRLHASNRLSDMLYEEFPVGTDGKAAPQMHLTLPPAKAQVQQEDEDSDATVDMPDVKDDSDSDSDSDKGGGAGGAGADGSDGETSEDFFSDDGEEVPGTPPSSGIVRMDPPGAPKGKQKEEEEPDVIQPDSQMAVVAEVPVVVTPAQADAAKSGDESPGDGTQITKKDVDAAAQQVANNTTGGDVEEPAEYSTQLSKEERVELAKLWQRGRSEHKKLKRDLRQAEWMDDSLRKRYLQARGDMETVQGRVQADPRFKGRANIMNDKLDKLKATYNFHNERLKGKSAPKASAAEPPAPPKKPDDQPPPPAAPVVAAAPAQEPERPTATPVVNNITINNPREHHKKKYVAQPDKPLNAWVNGKLHGKKGQNTGYLDAQDHNFKLGGVLTLSEKAAEPTVATTIAAADTGRTIAALKEEIARLRQNTQESEVGFGNLRQQKEAVEMEMARLKEAADKRERELTIQTGRVVNDKRKLERDLDAEKTKAEDLRAQLRSMDSLKATADSRRADIEEAEGEGFKRGSEERRQAHQVEMDKLIKKRESLEKARTTMIEENQRLKDQLVRLETQLNSPELKGEANEELRTKLNNEHALQLDQLRASLELRHASALTAARQEERARMREEQRKIVDESERINKDLSAKEAELIAANLLTATLQKSIEDVRAAHKTDKQAEILKAVKNREAVLAQEWSLAEQRIKDQYEERISNGQALVDSLERERDQAQALFEKMKNSKEEKASQVSERDTKIAEQIQRITELEDAISKATTEKNTAVLEAEDARKELKTAKSFEEANTKLNALVKTMKQSAKSEKKEYDQRVAALQAQYDDVEAKNTAGRAELTRLESEVADLNRKLDEAKSTSETALKQAQDSVAIWRSRYQAKAEEAEAEIKRISEAKERTQKLAETVKSQVETLSKAQRTAQIKLSKASERAAAKTADLKRVAAMNEEMGKRLAIPNMQNFAFEDVESAKASLRAIEERAQPNRGKRVRGMLDTVNDFIGGIFGSAVAPEPVDGGGDERPAKRHARPNVNQILRPTMATGGSGSSFGGGGSGGGGGGDDDESEGAYATERELQDGHEVTAAREARKAEEHFVNDFKYTAASHVQDAYTSGPVTVGHTVPGSGGAVAKQDRVTRQLARSLVRAPGMHTESIRQASTPQGQLRQELAKWTESIQNRKLVTEVVKTVERRKKAEKNAGVAIPVKAGESFLDAAKQTHPGKYDNVSSTEVVDAYQTKKALIQLLEDEDAHDEEERRQFRLGLEDIDRRFPDLDKLYRTWKNSTDDMDEETKPRNPLKRGFTPKKKKEEKKDKKKKDGDESEAERD